MKTLKKNVSEKSGVGPIAGRRFFARAASLLVFLFLLCGLLVGCKGPTPPMTEYLSSPLDAELTVTANGITYRVTLRLGAADAESGLRDSETVFLSPASLAGLTVRETGDRCTLSLGELSVPYEKDRDEGLLLAASLLSPGTVIGRETGTENGATCLLLRFGDGRTVSVDPASGQILAVRRGDVTATVAWCEPRKSPGEGGEGR